jgi:hypothetical protein
MDLNDAPRFLTYEQLADCITRAEYKPDWTISVFNDPYEGPCLYLTADVVDGYDHTKTVPLRIRSNIPHCTTPGDFYRWLQWRLIQVEIHEAREYVHVDGEPWSDPHDVIEPYREGDEHSFSKREPFDNADNPMLQLAEAARKRFTVNPPSPGFNDNSVSMNVEMPPQGKAHPNTMAGS